MLEKLLRSKAEVKVLGIVLFEDGLHLREIARRAGVSPYEGKRELDNLVGIGVLEAERRGKQVFFSQNTSCPFFSELKMLYSKTEGISKDLRDALLDIRGVKYAFIFGSAASGKERAKSDIDLIIIGDMDEEAMAENMLKLQNKMSREINYITWTEKDFKQKAREESKFLGNLLKKDRIWLKGDENEFIRTAKKRDA